MIDKEVKLVRLHDIVLHHLKKQNENITLGELEDLERDIVVYIKNLIMALEAIDGKAEISFIGDNNKSKDALCGGEFD